MADPLLVRDFYPYISDDGITYNIATTQANGNAQSATPVLPKANPKYPYAKGGARHVYGVNGTNRTKCPIFDPSDAIFVGSATTFTKNGVTFTVEGIVGERR